MKRSIGRILVSQETLNRGEVVRDFCDRRLSRKEAAAAIGKSERQVSRMVERWLCKGVLGVGFSRIAISTDVSALKLDGEQLASFAHVVFSAFFIGPALGVSFDLSTRLRLAIEIGVRIPVLFSGSLEMIDKTTGATSANSETLKVSQGQAMSRIAGLVLPTLTLLRFTWLL